MSTRSDEAALAAIGAAARELRLPTIRSEVARLAEIATHDRQSYLVFLAELLAAEVDDRAEEAPRRDRIELPAHGVLRGRHRRELVGEEPAELRIRLPRREGAGVEIRAHRLGRRATALRELGEGASARQIVEHVYTDVDEKLWDAAEKSVQAQLDYLRRD